MENDQSSTKSSDKSQKSEKYMKITLFLFRKAIIFCNGTFFLKYFYANCLKYMNTRYIFPSILIVLIPFLRFELAQLEKDIDTY